MSGPLAELSVSRTGRWRALEPRHRGGL